MGDSYLSGTNKQDQGASSNARGNSSERDPKRQASENSNHGFPGVQERQGQTKATNEGKNAANKGGSSADSSENNSSNGEETDRSNQKQSLGASTGEQHIRSIDTPPGEPYNDPHVRH